MSILDDSNGKYEFSGAGEVECLPRACFFSNGDWTRMLSGRFNLDMVADGSFSQQQSVQMWQSDAMQLLTEVVGPNLDLGDFVGITPDPDPFQPAILNAVECCNTSFGITAGAGYSFFVGIPQTGTVVRQVTATVHANETVTPGVRLSDGICTFSEISPSTHASSGSLARLVRSGNPPAWTATGGSNLNHAVLRCYLFDQSQ